MFKIADRYIFREVTTLWLIVTAILLAFLFSNVAARLLAAAAANEIETASVGAMLGLNSIKYLTTLIPFSFFLATMLALGRMYQDSEMPAYQACGYGPKRIYKPLYMIAIPATLLMAWLSLDLGPWAATTQFSQVREQQARLSFGNLRPGQFRAVGGGKTVFYAENIDSDGQLRNIFIRSQNEGREEVIVADRGVQSLEDGRPRSLTLYDGRRYEGVPGQSDFRIIDFSSHGIPIDLPPPDLVSDDLELMSSLDLASSDGLEERSELHWRISQPFAVLVLTFLAVPLSRTDPRKGRYGKLIIGILIYLIYSNLLASALVMVRNGNVPAWVGTWWVHGAVIALAAILLSSDRIRLGRAARRSLPAPAS